MRGRRPEPAAVQEAKGNPGRRGKRAAPEFDIAPAPGEAPSYLSADARRIWGALAPELDRLKFLRATDVPAFARWCDALARYWKTRRRIEREGETYLVESKHGTYRRAHPLTGQEERLSRRLLELEDRFGLSPAARQRIFQQLASSPLTLPLGEPKPAEPEAPPPDSPVGLLARLGTERPN